MMRAAMKAPIAIPGTNPAANDLPLKSESVLLGSPSPGCTLTPPFDALDVEVAVPVAPIAVEVELGPDGDTGVGAVFAMHCPLLQL